MRGPSGWAAAVPTITGTTAAGKVRGRAPRTHRFTGPGAVGTGAEGAAPSGVTPALYPGDHVAGCSRSAGETAEFGRPVLLEGVATLLALFTHVEEHGGITGELLEPGQPVVGSMETALEHSQRHR